jgi:hypothetical protein
MQLKLLERRRELIKNKNLGFSLSDVVTALASKYDVTEQAIYNDYRRRKTWLPFLLEIDDPQGFFYDLLAQHREIYRLCSLEFLKADNSNAKIGALRLLRDLNMDLIELVSLHDVSQRLERMERQQ